jgi:menaquinone-dependent protoporphyrinogen oxidase
MKTVAIFSSSHGTTEKAANMLKENLKGEVTTINLRKDNNPNVEDYDAIIIGGSIHAGSMQSKVKKFVEKNKDVLTTKKLGLFICCMDEKKAQEQFENAYPEDLRKASVSSGLFGGEFLLDKMNFVERMIVKKVSGQTSNVSKLNENAIKKFAEDFNLNI